MFLEKHIQKRLMFLALLLVISLRVEAQKVRVIDNKGTIKNANKNKVFLNSNDPNTIAPESAARRAEGDIWYNTSTKVTKIWDAYTDNSTTPPTETGKWEILIDTSPPLNVFNTSDTDETFTLENHHHTIITQPLTSGNNMTFNFPNPTTVPGKVYRVINFSNVPANLNCVGCASSPFPFVGRDGSNLIQLNYNRVYILQSDGVQWQYINNY